MGTPQGGASRHLRRVLAGALTLFAQGAWAEIEITVGGNSGPVTVTAGQEVTFAVTATDCASPNFLQDWTDRWLVNDIQAVEDTPSTSPCERTNASPITWSPSFDEGDHRVQFVSRYRACAFEFFGICVGEQEQEDQRGGIDVEALPPPEVVLEVNGSTDPAPVSPGEQVVLSVEAEHCPSIADRWRDTWGDPDGIGLPNTGASEHGSALCERSLSRTIVAPDSPGSYEITFEADWCHDGVQESCPTNSDPTGTDYEHFGASSVTVEVVQPEVVLLANGTAGTVHVSPGDDVTLTVAAHSCPGDADFWRDTWTDHDDAGVPNPGPSAPTRDSPCGEQRSQTFQAPTTAGTYSVTYLSEFCSGAGQSCRNRFGQTATEFGQSMVTIEVIDEGACAVGDGFGLLGEYWEMDSGDFPQPAMPGTAPNAAQIDPTIDFDWGQGAPEVDGIGQSNHFVVRWRGSIQSRCAGPYEFRATSDDGIRVYIEVDGVQEEVLNHTQSWVDQSATEHTGSIVLPEAGTRYPIVVEYYERTGDAVARLEWRPVTAPGGDPVSSYAVVPAMQLYPQVSEPGDLVAAYFMDESGWTGVTGEVIDHASGKHGTAYGGATTGGADPPDPPPPGVGTTCRYGVFDGSNDYVEASGLSDTLNGTATLTFWIRTTQNGADRAWEAPGISGVEVDAGQDDVFWGWVDGSGRIGVAVGDDYENDQKSTTRINDGTWYHIALSRDAGTNQTRVHVNGMRENTGDTGTGAVGTPFDSIGRIENTAGDYFEGDLDEVRVYDRVLSDSEVISVYYATRPCGPIIDHYAVLDPGQGVTCEALPVTIEAHDASHTAAEPPNGTTITVVAVGADASWASSGADTTSRTFDGSADSLTLQLRRTSAGTVDVDVDDGAASEDGAHDPVIAFAESGFLFYADGSAATPIGDQIAAKPSNTAPGDQALALRAVQDPNGPLPGAACEARLTDGHAIDMAFECRDPDTCAGQSVQIGADSAAGNPAGAVSSWSAVTLDFGADGRAPLVVSYPDAGEIRLHARANLPASGDEPAVALSGASNAFVVRPFGLEVAVPDDTADTGPAADTFLFTAGAPFAATVTARGWQAADDADADGLPDDGADLASGNAALPNFGQETAAETVVLAPALVAPAGGIDGALANATFDNFAGGARTRNDLAWGEVGYVDLEAALGDGDYLGAGPVTGVADTVGRFIPADFAVALRAPGLYEATCAGSFSYMGQPFGYTLAPELQITARNALGATTQNYRGAYNKLAADDVAVSAPGTDASALGRSGAADVAVSPALNAGTMSDEGAGVTAYTFADSDRYAYDKVENARVAPFDADLPLTVTDVTDADGVSDGSLPGPFTPAGVELRFGRLLIDNAGGAEIAPIDLPVRAEYWTGTTWNVNTADSCTTLALTSEIQISNDSGTLAGDQPIGIGGGSTSIESGDPVLAGGLAHITFAAPGAGYTGWVDLTGLLAAGSPAQTHLRGDPEEDGSWTTDPTGRATFGIYTGSDRWIDIRRVPVN